MKHSSFLRNTRGDTLVSILLGLGLLAVTGLGFATLFRDAFKLSYQVQRVVDVAQKSIELNNILMNTSACTASFAGVPLNLNTDVTIKNPSGTGVFLAKGENIIKGVNVRKIQWKSVSIDPLNTTSATSTLELSYNLMNDTNIKTKEYLVFTRRDTTTNAITSCTSASAYVRGGVYGNCEVTQGPSWTTIQKGPAIWPVTKCDHPVTCAAGFTGTTVSFQQGNTTANGVPNGANDIYWISDACIKD